MNVCPRCGWPTGNRHWARARSGMAACMGPDDMVDLGLDPPPATVPLDLTPHGDAIDYDDGIGGWDR